MRRYLLGLCQDESSRIPQFVAEVAIAGHASQVEANVAARRGEGRERESQGVRSVGLDALRKLLARGLLDRGRVLRLHQARGPFGNEGLEIDAVHDVQRIEHVSLGLRHLIAALIANEPRDVDVPERHVTHEFQPHHHHPCHPKEDDVETCDQNVRRIELRQLGRLRGPPQRGEGPQPGGEPGIEHILVLA